MFESHDFLQLSPDSPKSRLSRSGAGLCVLESDVHKTVMLCHLALGPLPTSSTPIARFASDFFAPPLNPQPSTLNPKP